jgi:hypothetical protein
MGEVKRIHEITRELDEKPSSAHRCGKVAPCSPASRLPSRAAHAGPLARRLRRLPPCGRRVGPDARRLRRPRPRLRVALVVSRGRWSERSAGGSEQSPAGAPRAAAGAWTSPGVTDGWRTPLRGESFVQSPSSALSPTGSPHRGAEPGSSWGLGRVWLDAGEHRGRPHQATGGGDEPPIEATILGLGFATAAPVDVGRPGLAPSTATRSGAARRNGRDPERPLRRNLQAAVFARGRGEGGSAESAAPLFWGGWRRVGGGPHGAGDAAERSHRGPALPPGGCLRSRFPLEAIER